MNSLINYQLFFFQAIFFHSRLNLSVHLSVHPEFLNRYFPVTIVSERMAILKSFYPDYTALQSPGGQPCVFQISKISGTPLPARSPIPMILNIFISALFLRSDIPPFSIWCFPVRIYPGFSIITRSVSFRITILRGTKKSVLVRQLASAYRITLCTGVSSILVIPSNLNGIFRSFVILLFTRKKKSNKFPVLSPELDCRRSVHLIVGSSISL